MAIWEELEEKMVILEGLKVEDDKWEELEERKGKSGWK